MFGIPSPYVIIAALLLLGAVAVASYTKGYNVAETVYKLEIAKQEIALRKATQEEIERQIAANKEAQEISKQIIEKLRITNNNLEDLITKNEEEAAKDPNAQSGGIGGPSIERLNRIQ